MTEQAPHLVRLNEPQYRAVTTVEGPVLVLAGAGSGKTRVLTRRIAHLLHLGVDPRHIFAVTFTNKAAAEMKERVAELVGEAGRKVWVSTFHSSCCRILRYDIEALGYTRRFSIYDDDDQRRIVKQLIKDHGYDPKKVTASSVMSQIDHYKNRMQTPDDLVDQFRSHQRHYLIRLWRDYEDALKAADALDFNDLIGMTVRLWREHPDILAKWQERFEYLLVDEYQDTNHTQYTLLHMLAAKHHNLMVVGDDDQSIYGFRGADISNILEFERDYPDAKVIPLEQNYRSSNNILTLANAVVQENTGRREKRLWTEADGGSPINFLVAESPRDEANLIARAINQLVRQGYRHGDIAIIYRTNATSRPFEQALRQLRIPHRVVGGRKFYERREIRDTLAYLRLVVNPADDAAFLRIVNVPTRGLGTKSIAKLREESARRGEPLLRTARARSGDESKRGKSLRAFVNLIDELSRLAREVSPSELVERVLEDSGYRAMLEAEGTREAEGRLENLRELLRDAAGIAPDAPDAGPFDLVQLWLDRVALTGQDEDVPEGGEVTLMTVHNSKGLEYPAVFVVRMNEGQFPHARCEEDQVEEERRLAYVAFTRAMKRLIVSYSRTDLSNQGGGYMQTKPIAPSPFLFGLPANICVGGPPSAEPAVEVELDADVGRARDRLASFLERRRAASRPATPSGAYRVVEIEDLSQLVRGQRVYHQRRGFGTVERLVPPGQAVLVRFEGSGPVRVPLRNSGLQLVVD